jgi:predicted nucleic acid-binding protein
VKISEALNGVNLLCVDTAPFIYFTEKRVDAVDKMRAIFTTMSAGQFEVITSPVTLPETLMKPLQAEDEPLIVQYRTMFFHTKGIAIAAITAQTGSVAADLRARYNLRTPDALHLATALDAGCDAFLTNDLGLKRVTDLRILVLDDLELDDPEDADSDDE